MDTPNEGLIVIGGPGEFIDEMSLLNHDGLRTTSVRLHSDVQPLEMRRGEFDALLGRKPSIAYEMLRVLSARLGQAHNESIRELKEKNCRLTEAYDNLKVAQQQIIQMEILERGPHRAHKIQDSVLPSELLFFEGFSLGARVPPAHMVGGQSLGIFPNPVLENQRLEVAPGNTLLLYTDGVTEARNEQGEFFELEGFLAALPDLMDNSTQGPCAHLIQTLLDYHGTAPQAADILKQLDSSVSP